MITLVGDAFKHVPVVYDTACNQTTRYTLIYYICIIYIIHET